MKITVERSNAEETTREQWIFVLVPAHATLLLDRYTREQRASRRAKFREVEHYDQSRQRRDVAPDDLPPLPADVAAEAHRRCCAGITVRRTPL